MNHPKAWRRPVDLNPPAVLDQPGWKPRHRVDPMRPANPRFTDTELEDLYQDFYKGRTGPNLFIMLIVAVICLFIIAGVTALVVINYGAGQ